MKKLDPEKVIAMLDRARRRHLAAAERFKQEAKSYNALVELAVCEALIDVHSAIEEAIVEAQDEDNDDDGEVS